MALVAVAAAEVAMVSEAVPRSSPMKEVPVADPRLRELKLAGVLAALLTKLTKTPAAADGAMDKPPLLAREPVM